MAQTATVAFETNDLIAALLGEVEEIVTLIGRPVGWLTQQPHPAPTAPPTDVASFETGGCRQKGFPPA